MTHATALAANIAATYQALRASRTIEHSVGETARAVPAISRRLVDLRLLYVALYRLNPLEAGRASHGINAVLRRLSPRTVN